MDYKKFCIQAFLIVFLLFNVYALKAQFTSNSDSAFKANKPNSGRLWGYAFADYYYKGHADTLNRGGGTSTQVFRKQQMHSR